MLWTDTHDMLWTIAHDIHMIMTGRLHMTFKDRCACRDVSTHSHTRATTHICNSLMRTLRRSARGCRWSCRGAWRSSTATSPALDPGAYADFSTCDYNRAFPSPDLAASVALLLFLGNVYLLRHSAQWCDFAGGARCGRATARAATLRWSWRSWRAWRRSWRSCRLPLPSTRR